MKTSHVVIFVVAGAVALFVGYNYYQTGTLGGGGTVGEVNTTSGYDSLIDALSSSAAVLGITNTGGS
jgi:hypothetical protein